MEVRLVTVQCNLKNSVSRDNVCCLFNLQGPDLYEVALLLLIFAQRSCNSSKTTLHNTTGFMDFQRKLQQNN